MTTRKGTPLARFRWRVAGFRWRGTVDDGGGGGDLHRPHCRGGFVPGFHIFGGRHRLSDDACPGLHAGDPVTNAGSADRDRHIGVTGEVEVADGATVDAATSR